MAIKELTKADVLAYIDGKIGAFSASEIKEGLGIISLSGKKNLYVHLSRLEVDGVIEKLSPGIYRLKNAKKVVIAWGESDLTANLKLNLPFELHNLCKFYPRSIIIVAGGKNAGKTAFLLECIKRNLGNIDLELFNSETGAEQLKNRFELLGVTWPTLFPTYECYDHFADQITPDKMAIIDYLDLNSEVYRAGIEIDNIFKVTKSAAIIGMQLPPPVISTYKGKTTVTQRELAYGGGFTAKRANLYISMWRVSKSECRLKITHCKTPMNPKIDPNNMMWSYRFNENGQFTDIKPYYEVTDYDNNV